jgi:hypothetical protein
MSNALKNKAACKMVEECEDTWNITISGGTPEMIIFSSEKCGEKVFNSVKFPDTIQSVKKTL